MHRRDLAKYRLGRGYTGDAGAEARIMILLLRRLFSKPFVEHGAREPDVPADTAPRSELTERGRQSTDAQSFDTSNVDAPGGT